MKLQRTLSILSVFATLAFCQTAFGQFDRLLNNIGNQARQEFGRAIQDAIPQVMPGGGGHRTLPVDPPTIKPPVFPPVHPPVDPPSCGRPPITWPPVNPPVYPPPVYPPTPPVINPPPVITPAPPVVTPPTPAGPVPVPTPNASIRPVLSHEMGHVSQQANGARSPRIESGDLVAIESEAQLFGNRRGSVTLSLGGAGLAAVPVSWAPGLVRARLPALPLGAAAYATVSVHNSNMELVEQLDITLTPSTGGTSGATSPSKTATIRPDSRTSITPASSTTPNTGGISAETGVKLLQGAAALTMAVQVGKLIALAGDDFGDEKGTAKMSVSAMSFDTVVTSWINDRVTLQLPKLELNGPVDGQIHLYRADGSLVTTLDVQFTPAGSESDSMVRIEQ